MRAGMKIEEIIKENSIQSGKPKSYYHAYDLLLGNFLNIDSEKIKILEMGLGRHPPPIDRHPLNIWQKYFDNCHVFGLDTNAGHLRHSSPLSKDGKSEISVYVGKQQDIELLDKIVERAGGSIDVIIDDASHGMMEQQTSFFHLFPKLSPGGLYFIEDLQTSFFKVGVKSANRSEYPIAVKEENELRTAELASMLSLISIAQSRICQAKANINDNEFKKLLITKQFSRVIGLLKEGELEMLFDNVESVFSHPTFIAIRKRK